MIPYRKVFEKTEGVFKNARMCLSMSIVISIAIEYANLRRQNRHKNRSD